MHQPVGIQTLSNELLQEILNHIDVDPDRAIPVDRRAYLSVESFRLPSPPIPPRAQDIASFRLVCRRFADLGAPHQFTRIATRFSKAGLQRLEKIASQPHLARHTKKFSYLIPCFYVEGRSRVRDLAIAARGGVLPDPCHFEKRVDAQRSIVKSGEDLRVLKKAMSAFKGLQHVQILRIQDEIDRHLLDYLNNHPEDTGQYVQLKWEPACTHASQTIGQALFHARSTVSRFSGPMMTPQSALAIKDKIPPTVTGLAERLTCLELHFDGGIELKQSMSNLSRVFRSIFTAARNMQAVHVGFPSGQPLDLPLEDIFHHVNWEKLRAFGVQAWRLHADEIIELARRHRKTLRGLRLRDVQLREGSLWKDVLVMLREEMEQLEWVSLRRIDYADHFDEMWGGSMEVPDWPNASDSDDEDDFPSHIDLQPEEENAQEDTDEDDSDDFSDNSSEGNSDHGPSANGIALSPDTPASLPFCTCSRSSYPATADDLGDNGRFVVYQQRKLWEKWVAGRCPEHSAS